MTGSVKSDLVLRVLFIDDAAEEHGDAAQYVQALVKSVVFGVEVQTTVTDAIEYINRPNAKDAAEHLVVLDLMMPVQDKLDLDPMEVGYYILRHHLRPAESAYRNVPVLILTNRDREEAQKLVEGIGGVWVRHKSEVPSFHLPKLLEEIVQTSKEMP